MDEPGPSRITPLANKLVKNDVFYRAIYHALKKNHPESVISVKSMELMNSFVYDLFEKITSKSSNLCRETKKHTIFRREIQTAMCLVLPSDLAIEAITAGTNAIIKFYKKNGIRKDKYDGKYQHGDDNEDSDEMEIGDESETEDENEYEFEDDDQDESGDEVESGEEDDVDVSLEEDDEDEIEVLLEDEDDVEVSFKDDDKGKNIENDGKNDG